MLWILLISVLISVLCVAVYCWIVLNRNVAAILLLKIESSN
ncbi:MAG: hypothetical protein OFPII_29430 [Osedax symbiont Rs1]|nr:MAG: hypothetical protein OFPII_29430 [Osedax symbiont Rs1]